MPELKPYREFASLLESALDQAGTRQQVSYQQMEEARRLVGAGSIFQQMRFNRNPLLFVAAAAWGLIGFSLIPLIDGLDIWPFEFLGFCGGAFCWVGGEIGILVGGTILMNRLIASRLGGPVMQASADRLRRGDRLDVTYVQEVKGQVNIQSVRIRFLKRETATYTSGTDKTTIKHDQVIGQEERPGRVMQRGYMLDERASFDLPRDAMHTFIASHNRIQWFVEVQVSVPMWPDFNEVYEIVVLPEAARD